MKVRILGAHNMEVQESKHTCFLVDDAMAIDAGSLMTSLSPEELDDIKAVLVTHRHFDHVRDLPSLGLNTLYNGASVSAYSLRETLDAVFSRLMDGVLYPDLATDLTGGGPKYKLHPIAPKQVVEVLGYAVRPIEVPHAAPTLGYIIHQAEGGSFAYCGDSGGGLLPFFKDAFKPDPIFLEVTFASRMNDLAKLTGHLTPDLLRKEIEDAQTERVPIPRIMVVHRQPSHEDEIREELAKVSAELKVEIALAQENGAVET